MLQILKRSGVRKNYSVTSQLQTLVLAVIADE